MNKFGSMIAVTLLAVTTPTFGQPAGKESAVKDSLALIELLKGKPTTSRHQVYLKLMSSRPLSKELVAPLGKVISSETGDSRILAAAVLAEITPKDAGLVVPLSEGVAVKDPQVAIAALKGLERLGPLAKPALPKVLVAMENTNGSVRSAAIKPAASAGKDAIVPLEKIIRKAGDTRKKNDHAAIALGMVGPDATSEILKLFDLDDPEMDYHAAVALKSMDKKAPEALKPMMGLAAHKDWKIRRPVFDYLVAVMPETEALNDVLWKGMDDLDGTIAVKCRTVMRLRTTDKAKWATALKKALERGGLGGSLTILHEFYQFDRQEAEKHMAASMHRVLRYQFTEKWRPAVLATFEKELIPHLPEVYKYLDGPSKGAIGSRLNAIALLTHLPPEHTTPVIAKLQSDLKADRWELKLIAAEALLRTNPADKAPIARAFAEVLTTPKVKNVLSPDEVLASLRRMGPEGAAAVPGLRIAQNTARSDVRAKMLLTMVALDPEQKAYVINIAEKMRADAKGSFAGAAVLLELDAIKADDAVKAFAPTFEGKGAPNLLALRAIELVGPKVKALAPKLEAALVDAKNPYPAQTVFALHKIDGDTRLALERLIQIARDDPKQFGNVVQVCGQFGAAARPVLPDLLEMRSEHKAVFEFNPAIMRIDPTAFFRSGE